MRRFLGLLLFLSPILLLAQDATVFGTVRDEDGKPLQDVSIAVVGQQATTQSNEKGAFEIHAPANVAITLRFVYPGSVAVEKDLKLVVGERRKVDAEVATSVLGEAVVHSDHLRDVDIEKIDPKVSKFQPGLGDVNSLLTGRGATTRNELSSGYNVRGGNFDENLVYVNDIEVYRPFLVRSGQQEGLSFPNPDMIERIRFSAGGFEARYGDKMSSVLDIQYKRPREFSATAMASLLGGSVSVASPMLNKRLRQVTGFRYRTLNSLLSGLDTKGDYAPIYTDLQTYWTYDLSTKVELGFLGVYSRNRYDVVPTDRETELGNFNEALRFTVYFEGQEKTAYETYSGALNVNVKATKKTLLKFTGSAFKTYESERFDILGQYRLSELDRDLGSDQFGQPIKQLGVGTFLDHARNQLEATVYSVAHKGTYHILQTSTRDHELQWGVDARNEIIKDKLSEWNLVDSSDYSIPNSAGHPETLTLMHSVKSTADLNTIRTAAYVQHAWEWKNGRGRNWALTAGVRGQYWSYNQQTVISPRLRVAFHPGWRKIVAPGDTTERDYTFWFATGFYYQPPFYRELRDFSGVLNPELRAQRSIHFIFGVDRQFKIWDRPFKWSAEVYYKMLDDLVPYELQNVRIRYYATNNASGYAAGLDLKLNGEFIKGIESWASLNVLSTQENLSDDYYYKRYNAAGERIYPGYTFDTKAVDSTIVHPGFIPRPSDQRVNFALFFQDEMPRFPTFKVHVGLVFGTSVPYGPPNYTRYPDTLRTSMYRRVDIGFSKQLLGAKGQEKTNFMRHIKSMFISLEIFNLINLNNVVDYQWVQDVGGRYYAIPEYLTPRRFNLKLVAWF